MTMMSVFNKNLLYIMSIVLFALLAILGGGMFPAQLKQWILLYDLVLLEVLLVYPELKHNETLFVARARVWRGVFRDPLFYCGVALCLFLGLQYLNYCVVDPEQAYVWDKALRQWVIAQPKWPGLPYCVVQGEGRAVLDWFPTVIILALTVRHGLLKRTKRLFFDSICWLGFLLGFLGMIQFTLDNQFLFFWLDRKILSTIFSTFGYPNTAASFFPFICLLSVGRFFWGIEHQEVRKGKIHPALYLLPALTCFVSGFLTLSRAGVIFSIMIGVGSLVYGLIRYMGSWEWKNRIKGISFVAVLLIGGLIALMMPSNSGIRKEITNTDWETFLANPVTARAGYQAECAHEISADHPWFGVGAWGFRWYVPLYVKDEDKHQLAGAGQANVHNDTLQFLSEHGIIGFGLIFGCMASLLIPFFWQLFKSPKQVVTDEQADRCWFNRINVVYFFIALALLMMMVHSVVDVIFRSPACMALWAVAAPLAPGFILASRRSVPVAKPQSKDA